MVSKNKFVFLILVILVIAGGFWMYFVLKLQTDSPLALPHPSPSVSTIRSSDPLLKGVMSRWNALAEEIKAGNDTLTYAEKIELAISTLGNDTWYIQGNEGIYEDASQRKLIMKGVQGRLQSASATKSSNVLTLKADFADYNAETERLILRGRSQVVIHP